MLDELLSELGNPPKELKTVMCVKNLDSAESPQPPSPKLAYLKAPIICGAFSFYTRRVKLGQFVRDAV